MVIAPPPLSFRRSQDQNQISYTSVILYIVYHMIQCYLLVRVHAHIFMYGILSAYDTYHM